MKGMTLGAWLGLDPLRLTFSEIGALLLSMYVMLFGVYYLDDVIVRLYSISVYFSVEW